MGSTIKPGSLVMKDELLVTALRPNESAMQTKGNGATTSTSHQLCTARLVQSQERRTRCAWRSSCFKILPDCALVPLQRCGVVFPTASKLGTSVTRFLRCCNPGPTSLGSFLQQESLMEDSTP